MEAVNTEKLQNRLLVK